MDFSCGEGCMSQWGCSWCHNNFCDDICSPYRLRGKPKYWSEHENCKNSDYFKNYWNSLTEKEKNKTRKKYSLIPEMTEFFLCDSCKNKYIENNICKGRHKDKFDKGYYW